jgi:hypothetical protein
MWEMMAFGMINEQDEVQKIEERYQIYTPERNGSFYGVSDEISRGSRMTIQTEVRKNS